MQVNPVSSAIAISLLFYYSVYPIFSQTNDVYVQNMDAHCLRCLCYAATNCNLTFGCIDGYCGPYKIGRVYWVDAGKVVMPEDEVERVGAYQDCALNYHCAQRMVINYMAKFGKDCNGDGVTNCDDYSMINFNGGYQCTPDLNRNEFGKNWTIRYNQCSPVL